MGKKKEGGQKYFVSRQKYWGVEEEEGTVVEISVGGSDYANPDMLGEKWPRLGEGQTFDDPREAVKAAIAVCDAWKAAGETNAKVAYGSTGGFTLPFEGTDSEAATAWAEALYEKLPKCEECGELLGKETYGNEYSIMGGEYPFCREYCAEKNERRTHEENVKDGLEEESE